MDPLADKVLVTTALVMLIPTGKVPARLALIILCREIVITGLRGVASSEGIVVSANGLGKMKSIIQYIGLGTLIFPPWGSWHQTLSPPDRPGHSLCGPGGHGLVRHRLFLQPAPRLSRDDR